MPALVNSNLLVSNDRLESRMRENRQSGSEGGEPQTNAAFLPLSSAGVEGLVVIHILSGDVLAVPNV
jgi:hypothetical protein